MRGKKPLPVFSLQAHTMVESVAGSYDGAMAMNQVNFSQLRRRIAHVARTHLSRFKVNLDNNCLDEIADECFRVFVEAGEWNDAPTDTFPALSQGQLKIVGKVTNQWISLRRKEQHTIQVAAQLERNRARRSKCGEWLEWEDSQRRLFKSLQPREQKAVELLVWGFDRKDMASSLGVCERTLRSDLKKIRQELSRNPDFQELVKLLTGFRQPRVEGRRKPPRQARK